MLREIATALLRNALVMASVLPLCFFMGCPRTVTVPNVVGSDQAAATATLTGAELVLGTVTSAYSDTEPRGRVMSQNPASGNEVASGAAVNLLVSRGRVILADVNSPATPATQDGLTWATAYDTLQEALDAAYFRSAEVWATRGSYGENRAAKDAEGALVLREGIALYGGFAATENFREERNWASNITVIDGSDARAGSPAVHVVVGADDARLDGFTVRGGRAGDSSGGGMINMDVSPTIANCTFTNNSAARGGALGNWIISSSVTVINCTFTGNAASMHGGGIFTDLAALRVSGCTFDDNTAGDGGGIYNGGADITVENTTFSANSATSRGGGLISVQNGAAILTNCLFFANDAIRGSAVGTESNSAATTMTNCTFYGNTADDFGGALYLTYASLDAVNCILWGDTGGDEIEFGESVSVTVSHCCVEGGWFGGGTAISTENPMFLDSAAHDFRLQSTSPCLDTGTWVDVPAADIRGVARPQGSGIDRGAYEMATGDYD